MFLPGFDVSIKPGAGHFDAQAALRSVRGPGSWTANTFYVALSDQPTQPDIRLGWLAQRWGSRVDVNKWCTFEQFLADGGTVLLDGLNEGGLRAVPLERWMLQWRDVIDELFDNGAGRIVVTCRTRDQLIPVRAPRGEPPTTVSMLPLSKPDVVAIATERDLDVARRLDEAMTADPGLLGLYSNPFRLRAYLDSGVPDVVTTGAALFGFQISAAILRERERLDFHGDLIPERAAARLAQIRQSGDGDPWSALRAIPLIRSLGALAKVLTFPVRPAGQAPLTMSRDEAGEVLADALRGINHTAVDPDRVIDTARDLHILLEEDAQVRFVYPSLQHLFAAFGSSDAEIVALARDERQRDSAESGAADSGEEVTPPISPPSYSDHRYAEVFQYAAQLRGASVPDQLVPVDPVLAAQVYLSIRPESAMAAERIKSTLAGELDRARDHRERSAILAALGDLGWRLPNPRDDRARAVTPVPAGEWRLGLREADRGAVGGSASERRIIEMPGFQISRFPVGNAEFREFIEDGGYDEKKLWSPEGWEWRMSSRTVEQFVAGWGRRRDRLQRHQEQIVELLRSKRASPAGAAALLRFAHLRDAEIAEYARKQQSRRRTAPKYWERAALRNALQPVVGVSWFEANAFCEWLGRQLNTRVRLASENEWEAACLHALGVRDTAELPAAAANTRDRGYPATTPIGTFVTAQQTQLRLPVEMLGNVFEWVFDYYAPGDHNRRIVKGGSWRHEARRAHPAYRGRGDVDTQNEDLGFRYVIDEVSA